ncbi:MAG: Asp-tRNA(Asn)/Glu-tRNA(Gln) amidotransferase subunit GatB, partial [Bacteroidota bacterium]
LIDLNRAGVPLIELVTEPCISSSEEATAFLSEIRNTVRYLAICDGNMEQGSLRCDANISVRKRGEKALGKKVEVKNMNSMRNVGKAIDYEYKRQVELLECGEEIISETRLFDANRGTTSGMRTKEELNDYRYFPEPDLTPFEVSDEWLNRIASEMPATPSMLNEKQTSLYKLSSYDAEVLINEKVLAFYFEEVCSNTINFKQVANWIIGPIKALLNDQEMEETVMPVSPSTLAELIDLIANGSINHSVASKKIFPFLVKYPEASLNSALSELKLESVSNDDLLKEITDILGRFPDKVKSYQNGKKNLLGLFMGEVMKATDNTADPKKVNDLLKVALEKKQE